MSWNNKDVVALRHEFVVLLQQGGVSLSELCRRFGVSRKTGYKWRTRFQTEGAAALRDRRRRPARCRHQTASAIEQAIVGLRQEHPTWGPRKLQRRLADLGHTLLPGLGSFARILRRFGCVSPEQSLQRQPFQRFCRAEPNELWQMDFKGHFPLHRGGRCHPLTVLDDHSRFALGLQACADEQTSTVQLRLEGIFRCYGLPEAILCDNGSPWAGTGPEYSRLAVWLLRLGIRVLHGRPYHPQTQGKDERFHRTLQADLLARQDWLDLDQAQERFDAYRELYNHQRPHEALALAVPASRYRASARAMPAQLPLAVYAPDEIVRPVKAKGEITFRNRFFYVGQAFRGLRLALRPHQCDGVYRVCYDAISLGLIDLTGPPDRPRGHYNPLLPLDRKV